MPVRHGYLRAKLGCQGLDLVFLSTDSGFLLGAHTAGPDTDRAFLGVHHIKEHYALWDKEDGGDLTKQIDMLCTRLRDGHALLFGFLSENFSP